MLFILSMFIFSCEREIDSPVVNKINFLDLIEAGNLYEGDWNGYISIQGRKMFGDSEITKKNAQNSATARFWDEDGSPVTMSNVLVGDLSLSPIAEQNMTYKVSGRDRQATKHLFGTTTSVAVSSVNGREEEVGAELYCPPELVINEPVKTYSRVDNVNRQVLIQWNADYQNDKGVGIAVSYSKSGKNQGLNEESSSISVLVEDNGEYLLNIEENIPDEAVLTIYVIRGDIQGLNMEDQTYLATCYTLAYSEFKLAD